MDVGLIGSLGGLATSVINNYAADKRAQIDRQWNEDMQKQQNEWNLQMWNKQNEYNTPLAQLERLEDAGLNPLYHGLDGNSAGQIQSNTPLGGKMNNSTQGISNPFENYQDAVIKRAQIDNINADTAKKNNETLTETERRQNLIKERDEMDARIEKYKSSKKLDDKTVEKLELELSRYNEYIDAIINRENSAASLSDTQRKRIEELLPGEKEIQNMTVKDYEHKWSKWSAEIEHLANQDALLAKQCKYYLVSLLTNGVYGSGLSAVNALIFSEIANDPDLTPQQKQEIKDAFGISDEKSKKKNRITDYPIGETVGGMADPIGNYFGPTF